jgi:hypothetical protein
MTGQCNIYSNKPVYDSSESGVITNSIGILNLNDRGHGALVEKQTSHTLSIVPASLKHEVSEIEHCLRDQVMFSMLGPIDRTDL